MQYQSVTAGTFLERPNRFIAMVDLDGQTERVHVKNTGRCRELLVPGYKVYLAHGTNPNRKTRYDLIAVERSVPERLPCSSIWTPRFQTMLRRNGCARVRFSPKMP